MSESPRQVKYRVVGEHEDGQQVPLSTYLSLEAAERIASLARSNPAFKQIIIESDEEDIRRARV